MKMKKNTPVNTKEKRHRITLDIPPSLAHDFKVLCVKSHVTMNEILTRFIEQLLDQNK